MTLLRYRRGAPRLTIGALLVVLALGYLLNRGSAVSRLIRTTQSAPPVTSAPREPLPQESRVRRVIDGDTIVLESGQTVRYIGMDTPELRRRVDRKWVQDPEPFGEAAKAENERMVNGKTVRLEYDLDTYDRYGRLLAYVYVGDRMVNAALLEEGYAKLLTIPPNVKYVELFRRLSKESRRQQRGLWQEASGGSGQEHLVVDGHLEVKHVSQSP